MPCTTTQKQSMAMAPIGFILHLFDLDDGKHTRWDKICTTDLFSSYYRTIQVWSEHWTPIHMVGYLLVFQFYPKKTISLCVRFFFSLLLLLFFVLRVSFFLLRISKHLVCLKRWKRRTEWFNWKQNKGKTERKNPD